MLSIYSLYYRFFIFFKQKTAYEMRISDWSSDGCSSDLAGAAATESLGDVRLSSGVPPQFYFGGLFVAFYVIAVTFIAPRFGVGNAIFFVLVGQLASAAVIDHYGLFGAARFPIDAKRVAGIALMIAGVWLARRTG